MRRIIPILIVIIFALTSCAGAAEKSDPDSFNINITVKADGIYGIHIEYYIDDEPMGGRSGVNADNSMIKNGDVFTIDLIAEDFKDGTETDLSKLRVEVFAIDKNGREIKAGDTLDISAAFGEYLDVTLSGDTSNGFTLTEG